MVKSRNSLVAVSLIAAISTLNLTASAREPYSGGNEGGKLVILVASFE